MTNYKCVVTLHSGAHKFVRGAQDVVAHIVSEVRRARKSIFKLDDDETVYGIALNLIASVKFINEYTGEVYLEI